MGESADKTKILYFYDALCGWCYGFSPVIAKIYEAFQDKFDFEIISGGLKVGAQVGPIGEIAPYIKEGAYKRVEEMSGVKFGDAFINGPMEEGTMILNSIPPAIALAIVKEKAPKKAFEFGAILHRAIYFDGMHPEDIGAYGKYAEFIGFDAASFVEDMSKPIYQELAQRDISFTQKLGINGFPTMVAVKGNEGRIITRGYSNFESIASALNAL